MIVSCKCKHDGQDKLNGKGNRVANVAVKLTIDSKRPVSRCTVCLKVHQ